MLKKAICFFLLNCIFLHAHGMQTKSRNANFRHTPNPNDCNCGPFEVVLCKPNDSGFHPFPYDCNKYIKCEGGQTFIHDCIGDLSFSTQLKQCNTEHSTNCQLQSNVRRYSQTRDSTFEISTAYSTDLYREHSHGSGTQVYGNEAICNVNSPPIREHPSACWKYIRCEHGKAYIDNCPTGYGFNKSRKICIRDENCSFLARENAENHNNYGSGGNSNLNGQTQTSLNQNNRDQNHNQYKPNIPGYDYQGVRFDTGDTSSTDQDSRVQSGSGSHVQISSQRPYISPTDENSSSRPGTISGGTITFGSHTQQTHTSEYGHQYSYNNSYESSTSSPFPNLPGGQSGGFTNNAGTYNTRTNPTQISYADVVSGSSSPTGTSQTGIKDSRSGSPTRTQFGTDATHVLSNTLYENLQLESDFGGIHMGSVQMKINGKWHYICDDKFDIKAANVFCREIGFGEGAQQILSNSYFVTAEILNRQKIEFPDFNEIVCRGDEQSLKKCEFIAWDTSSCKADEVVGVICKLPHKVGCGRNEHFCGMRDQCIASRKVCDGIPDCSDLSDEAPPRCNRTVEYRLVDGISDSEGRLQMKHQGQWGTICDEYFGDLEAQVFCRSKGYYGHATFYREGPGHGYGPIWLTRHSCISTGANRNLASCNSGTFAPTNCDHSQDIRIKCIGAGSFPAE